MKPKTYYLFILKLFLSITLISCSSTNNTLQSFSDDFDDQGMPIDDSGLNSPHHIDSQFSLLPIPKSKIETADSTRNPFVAINQSSSTLSDLLPYGMRFTGIGTIGDSKVLFTETKNRINEFKLGEDIGNGFKVLSINVSPDQVKVSNGSKNYLIKFNHK